LNKPYTVEKDGYVSIEYAGTNGFLDEPGTPHLPIYQTVFEFSKDIKIYDVHLSFSKIPLRFILVLFQDKKLQEQKLDLLMHHKITLQKFFHNFREV
jgi:hypothetical protein